MEKKKAIKETLDGIVGHDDRTKSSGGKKGGK